MLVQIRLREDGILEKGTSIINNNETIPLSTEEKDYFRNVRFVFCDGAVQKIDLKTSRDEKPSGEVAYEQKLTPGVWNLGHKFAHKVISYDDMDLHGKVFHVTKGKVSRNRISFEGRQISIPRQKEGRSPFSWFAMKAKKCELKPVKEDVLEDYLFAMRKNNSEILNLVVNAEEDGEKIIAGLQKSL